MNYIALLKDKALTLSKKENFVSYFQNTFWLMFEKVFKLSVAFVIGVYVARYLGPKDFGIFNYGKSISIFFTTFATLSIDQFIVKLLIEKKDQKNHILGTYLGLRFVASVGCMLLVLLLNYLNAFEENEVFLIVLILTSASIFSSFDILQSYYQSQVDSKKIAFAAVLQIVIPSILKIYFVVYKFPVTYFALVTIVEAVVYTSGLVFFYNKNNQSVLQWRFNKALARETLKECWPMMISGLVIIIYMRIDQVMIKWLLDVESVGYYSAAVRLSEIWFFIGAVLCNSLFPALVKAKISSEELYNSRLASLLTLNVIIALAIIVPISFFSSTIISILFGPEFMPASSVLAIHAWSLLFIFLGQVGSRWLINENLQKLNLFRTVVGMFVNIILNFILIPRFGIKGAAFATLFSQMTASYLANYLSASSRSLFWAQTRSLFLLHLSSSLLSKKSPK